MDRARVYLCIGAIVAGIVRCLESSKTALIKGVKSALQNKIKNKKIEKKTRKYPSTSRRRNSNTDVVNETLCYEVK